MHYALCESASSDAADDPLVGKFLVEIGAIMRNHTANTSAVPDARNRIVVFPAFSHYTRNIQDYVGEENYILIEEPDMTDERADLLISRCSQLIADGARLITKEMINGKG